jgi:hypothetical protein
VRDLITNTRRAHAHSYTESCHLIPIELCEPCCVAHTFSKSPRTTADHEHFLNPGLGSGERMPSASKVPLSAILVNSICISVSKLFTPETERRLAPESNGLVTFLGLPRHFRPL